MLDELRARFRTRFIDTARGRVRRILVLLGQSEHAEELAAELHALAGEAAMLGLDEISETARRGEEAARSWHRGESSAQVRCARVARSLGQQIERFASGPSSAAEEAGAAPAEQAAVAPGEAAPAGGESAPGARVLVVDDSELVSAELVDALDQVGLDATSAADRAEALAALGAFRPRLVLADVHLPGEPPGALCRALRDSADYPLIVVLVSGRPDAELAALAADVGADGYVSKQRGRGGVIAYIQRQLAGNGER